MRERRAPDTLACFVVFPAPGRVEKLSGTGQGPGIILQECTGKNFLRVMTEGDCIDIESVDGDISIGAPEGLIALEAMDIEVLVHETLNIQVGTDYSETSGQADTRDIVGTAALGVGAAMSLEGSRDVEVKGGPKIEVTAAKVASTAGLLSTIIGLASVSLGAGTQKGIAILLNVMGGMKASLDGSKIALLDGTVFHSLKSILGTDVTALLLSFLGYAKTDFTSAGVNVVDAKQIHLNP